MQIEVLKDRYRGDLIKTINILLWSMAIGIFIIGLICLAQPSAYNNEATTVKTHQPSTTTYKSPATTTKTKTKTDISGNAEPSYESEDTIYSQEQEDNENYY